MYRKSTTLREQVAGDELMIADSRTDRVHVLNATSAAIWKLLDETADPALLESRLRQQFKVPAGYDVAGLVRRAIRQFVEKELLSPPETPGPA